MHSGSTATDQLLSTVAHTIQNLGRLNTHAMIIHATNTTNRHEPKTPDLFVSIRAIRGRIAWNQSACCNRSQMIRPNGLPDSTATDQLHSTGAKGGDVFAVKLTILCESELGLVQLSQAITQLPTDQRLEVLLHQFLQNVKSNPKHLLLFKQLFSSFCSKLSSSGEVAVIAVDVSSMIELTASNPPF
jgi:hypothetical protein